MYTVASDAVLNVIKVHSILYPVFRKILNDSSSDYMQAREVEVCCRQRFLHNDDTTNNLALHLLREFLDQVDWYSVVSELKKMPEMTTSSTRMSSINVSGKVAEDAKLAKEKKPKIIYL